MKKAGIVVLVLISWGFFFLVGVLMATSATYEQAAPMIEERVIKAVNANLREYGIKKFWFHTEAGSVIMRVRNTKGGYELWQREQGLRIERAERSRSTTSSTLSSTGGVTGHM